MCEVTARGKLNGQELANIPVLNPSDWFGTCWLLEIGASFSPLFLVVEADSVSDAIDKLADDAKYGHQIVVSDEDMSDYPEDDRHYGPSGQVLDLDHLLIHGREGSGCPFPCRYFGEGLPEEGMNPTDYWRREDGE
jgi:hypothetical protein